MGEWEWREGKGGGGRGHKVETVTPFSVEKHPITVQKASRSRSPSEPRTVLSLLRCEKRARVGLCVCVLPVLAAQTAQWLQRAPSHSTTDLRAGRLSAYVDHWGCQDLEEVKKNGGGDLEREREKEERGGGSD